MLVACCSSTSYLTLPISLNSLDHEGARLLSPRDSQITSKPDAGTNDTVTDDALELKWEFDEDSRRYMCLFQMISSGAQLGWSGTVSHVGVDLYFGTVVGPWVYWMIVMLFMYLCDVASVSQLCYLPFLLIILHGMFVKIA